MENLKDTTINKKDIVVSDEGIYGEVISIKKEEMTEAEYAKLSTINLVK